MTSQSPSDPAWPPELVQNLAWARQSGLSARLSGLYARLPATTCARQGHCCGLLPPLQPIEMLAWLSRWPAGGQAGADQSADLAEHFLANAMQRRPCPWARPGACAEYDMRFLACRAYGLWSEEAYAARRRAALAQQETVTAAWAGLGVRLPEAVLAPGPHNCQQVRLCDDGENRPSLDADLANLEAELADLAQNLAWGPGLAACNGDLAFLVARLALGEQACLTLKVRATRAGLAGRRAELAGIMANARQRARAWAAARPAQEPAASAP
ncbi:MAG: hypothetical protein V1797_17760 [Pseudomonadota bacterium]